MTLTSKTLKKALKYLLKSTLLQLGLNKINWVNIYYTNASLKKNFKKNLKKPLKYLLKFTLLQLGFNKINWGNIYYTNASLKKKFLKNYKISFEIFTKINSTIDSLKQN